MCPDMCREFVNIITVNKYQEKTATMTFFVAIARSVHKHSEIELALYYSTRAACWLGGAEKSGELSRR